MTEDSKALIQKTTADSGLVEAAYDKLSEIISTHYENAMMEAGCYLLNEFYEKNIEYAREKNLRKKNH